jgi:Undecaprenyl-phosphate galactose phosphotransferase WbaP
MPSLNPSPASGSPVKNPHPTIPPENAAAPEPPHANAGIPRRTLAVLFALLVLAVYFFYAARPALYYPRLLASAPDVAQSLQLDFFLQPQASHTQCQAAGQNLADTLAIACPVCRIHQPECIKNAPSAWLDRLGTAPLPVPSARLAHGVVLYLADHPQSAGQACEKSAQLTTSRPALAQLVCYPAGAPRPLSRTPKAPGDNAGLSAYFLLLTGMATLLMAMICAIFMAYQKQRKRTSEEKRLACHPRLVEFALASSDALVLLTAFVLLAWPDSFDMRYWSSIAPQTITRFVLVLALTLGWFGILLEQYSRRRPYWDELWEIVQVLLLMGLLSCSAEFVAGGETGRFNLVWVWLSSLCLLPLGRALVRWVLDDLGLWRCPALIVGDHAQACSAWRALREEHTLGLRLLGFSPADQAGLNPLSTGDQMHVDGQSFPVVSPDDIESLPPHTLIFIAQEFLAGETMPSRIAHWVANGRPVQLIPSLCGLPLLGMHLSHFFSHEVLLLTLRNNLNRASYRWAKRAFDVLAASALLLFLSPLMAYIAWRIWREDGFPVIFAHPRIGQYGTVFDCLKFRSMRSNADQLLADVLAHDSGAREEWARDFKLKNDPRLIGIGAYLRQTSLDELPQLINVLRGDMSLVGPRPIVPDELVRYGDKAHLYLQGLPGITGLWQVSGRNDTGYERRVSLDAWYIRNWSLWYDIAILFRTIDVVCRRQGAY